MPAVAAVERVSLRLGAFALRDIDLRVEAGDIMVVLGPNGAGKSVTLEAIAGFSRPDAGRIVIGGREVTDLPPERRRVGFVVQNFGLFPHLSVADNVAFGIAARGAARPMAASVEIAGLLAQFGIAHLADRAPLTLSPGEKQRVALARALATRPDLFLFDEPFSALDAKSRGALRDELKAFLRQTRIPAIFVTHDHSEAFVLADRIAVMHRGEIVQSGTVSDIYRRPASALIADFVGMENVLAGRLEGGSEAGWHVAVAGTVLCVARDGTPTPPAGPAFVCVRAEEVRLRPEASGKSAPNRLPGRVLTVTNLGPMARVAIDCGFPLVAYDLARDLRDRDIAPGQSVIAEIDPGAIHLLPR